MQFTEQDLETILHALNFAAEKHQDQRRKNRTTPPYINHPIHVVNILWDIGGVRHIPTLVAAALHDTLEDTDTTTEVLAAHFGVEVLALVQEVTDDKSLPKATRKQLQIEHAPYLSFEAKHIKLADKIDNVRDVGHNPPVNWTYQRLIAYLDWSEAVVAGLRGTNEKLEVYYDEVLREARQLLAH
ncbi:MAG: bifunctional (p)ppGpp synthetase/guanosine-3',5'-bis(diphosphate) 3'-pyrophosphohydrolase [Anaerolineae bacterium]|nr:bifunctional (p)ppGpp synthetase/guanosine-3',5'-bis(diphosphate) 3'-pyrophosphohydrolase [Anaerolineae bacterium]